jgi:hypothetical protein
MIQLEIQYGNLDSRIQTRESGHVCLPRGISNSTSYKREINRSIDRSAVFGLPPLPSPPHHPPVDLVAPGTTFRVELLKRRA